VLDLRITIMKRNSRERGIDLGLITRGFAITNSFIDQLDLGTHTTFPYDIQITHSLVVGILTRKSKT